MNTYSLKRLSLLLSALCIGAVVFGFTAINPVISWAQAWLRFGILLSAAVGFNLWLFRIIEQHEAEAQRRSEQLAALHKAALILTKEVDLATVLQRVVDEARGLAEAQYGAVGVLNEDGNYIDQFITSGITTQQRALLGQPPRGHGLLGVLIRTGEPIRIPSISEDPRSVGFPPHHPPMRSLLGVPISFQGEILGDLYLTDKLSPAGKVTAFSEQDQQLLEMFATQAAIAIKNAQFHRQSQQLTLLQERDRFGMDLHDGVIQSIYGIGLMLEEAHDRFETDAEGGKDLVSQAVEGLRRTIHDIRNYILDLRPERFQGRDLREGLAELAREVRAHSFLSIDIQVATEDLPRLSPEQTVEILHIIREALTNVRKHARASQVDIHIGSRSDALLLTIADNGIGLDLGLIDKGAGHGLHNMQERAQALGGKLSFTNPESGGTSVQLEIPLILTSSLQNL
ncbi:MAG TPA: GAF domain-containing sensor histidine kinase [Anaerolineales bacterium]|nr:GAF domain-containing sensor histidine kinase [Anaerolineales bacterium]